MKRWNLINLLLTAQGTLLAAFAGDPSLAKWAYTFFIAMREHSRTLN